MGKKSPFQKGVKVRVVIPERFVRCGYNLTPMIAADKLKAEHEQDIIEFLEKLGLDHLVDQYGKKSLNFDTNPIKRLRDHRLTDRLMGDLGYFYAGAMGMGGRTRKIHTVEAPEYAGYEATIYSSRSVMTGEYYGPSGGYDGYSGEYDYEPGGLAGQQHHRVHEIIGYNTKSLKSGQFDGLWFEQRCLEIIPDS